MISSVTSVRHGSVQIISLNRPESYNAINLELIKDLVSALASADTPEVRAVILRGEGRAFCSGGDVKAFQREIEKGAISLAMPMMLHHSISQIRQLPKPVIAVVQGACAGAGMSLTMACDMTMAAEDALFKVAYSGIGLSADGGSTYFLPRLVGIKKALEICFLSESLSSQEALQLGLINRVVPQADLQETAMSLAEQLALGPTAAFAKTKALINRSGQCDLNTQMELEALGVSEISETRDFREGVAAFIEKRKPSFIGT